MAELKTTYSNRVVSKKGFGIDGNAGNFQDASGNNAIHAIQIDTGVFRGNAVSTGTGHYIPANSIVTAVKSYIRTDDGAKTIDIGIAGNGDQIVDGFNPAAGVNEAVPLAIGAETIGAEGDNPYEIYMNMSVASANLAGTIVIEYCSKA